MRRMGMLLYYMHRFAATAGLRQAGAAAIASTIRTWRGDGRAGSGTGGTRQNETLLHLQSAGYAPMGSLLTPGQVDEVHTFLKEHPPYDLRDRTRVVAGDTLPDGVRYSEYRIADVLACPHLLEAINSPKVLAVAESYLGCKPTIAQMILRWTYATGLPDARFQLYHRDLDDWKFVKLFIYLTDVDDQSGPHTVVTETHRTRSSVQARYWTDDEMAARFPAGRMASLTGGSGSAWLVDTFAYHKGVNPVRSHRLALIVQYSLLPYFPYPYEAARPVSSCSTPKLEAYTNRLYVRG